MLGTFVFTLTLVVSGFASAKEPTPVCDEVFTLPAPLQDQLEASHIEFEDHAWFVVIKPDVSGEAVNQLAFYVQDFYRRNLVLLTDRGAKVQMDLENDEDLIIYFPEVLLQLSGNLPLLKEMIQNDFRAMCRRTEDFADKTLTMRNQEFADKTLTMRNQQFKHKAKTERVFELMMH